MGRKKNWDPILRYWPHPICHYPAIWELALYKDVEGGIIIDMLKDDPVPIRENMIGFYERRIEFTSKLMSKGTINQDLGTRFVEHFKTHIEELKIMQ